MILIKGKTYSAHGCVSQVTILQIYHVSKKGYTKAKVKITINGRLQEIKTYKLIHKRISHWRQV